MPKALDMLRKVQRGELPPPPVATLIGFTIGSIEPGRVVMEMEAGPQHVEPLGTVHGGILCDLADAAMGMAYAASLDENETFTTLELKINFLKPVWSGRLTATGYVVKSGRTVGWSTATCTTRRARWWRAPRAPA